MSFPLLERLHGLVGVLAVALLLHPLLLLRGGAAEARVSRAAGWAALLVALAALSGIALYPSYRALVRPGLLQDHRALFWTFERKEHLGAFSLFFALSGLLALRSKGRLGAALLGLSLVTAALAAGFGLVIASVADGHPG